MNDSIPPRLISLVSSKSSGPVNRDINLLVEKLLKRYGSAVRCIIFYGSCLREHDILDGIVDLYVVVDDYFRAYRNPYLSGFNKLLPPNVFYMETKWQDTTLRSKYGIFSMADMIKGTSTRWFHSYLWGRLAQPVRLVYTRDKETRACMEKVLAQAVVTFVSRVLPLMPKRFSSRELWTRGLCLSYSAELRPEKPDKCISLFEKESSYYEDLTKAVLAMPRFEVLMEERPDGCLYETRNSVFTRCLCRLSWGIRCIQGKVLSVLRLLKGIFTFENGLDYILWKIERHSGIRLDMPAEKESLWKTCLLFWRLYRRGAFH